MIHTKANRAIKGQQTCRICSIGQKGIIFTYILGTILYE